MDSCLWGLEFLVLKFSYITNISDYDMDTMEEVFYVLSRSKIENDVITEEFYAPPPYKKVETKDLPLDSKFFWKL